MPREARPAWYLTVYIRINVGALHLFAARTRHVQQTTSVRSRHRSPSALHYYYSGAREDESSRGDERRARRIFSVASVAAGAKTSQGLPVSVEG